MSDETNLVSTSDLNDGDLYRELQRHGDFVLVGSLHALLADSTEDANRTVYRQIGGGEDACRYAVARA